MRTDTSIESENDDAFFDSEDDDEDQDESKWALPYFKLYYAMNKSTGIVRYRILINKDCSSFTSIVLLVFLLYLVRLVLKPLSSKDSFRNYTDNSIAIW